MGDLWLSRFVDRRVRTMLVVKVDVANKKRARKTYLYQRAQLATVGSI